MMKAFSKSMNIYMVSARSVKLTPHFYLVLGLRMLGAIPPLTKYVFMAWCLGKHKDYFTSRSKRSDVLIDLLGQIGPFMTISVVV
jgi:hypothetical protein